MEKGLGEKSYTEFHVWVVLFAVSTVGLGAFPVKESLYISKVIIAWMAFSIVSLMYIIEQTEKVYWIKGISYEEAVNAGSKRRQKCAREHVKLFFWIFVIIDIYCGLGAIVKAPVDLDLIVCIAGLGLGIVDTVPAKL